MGKTTTVTFTKPIDHYAPGDVREVSADELKRLEEYATRWKIKDFYVKGSQTLDQPEVARPSKTTGVVTSDGSKPQSTRPRAAQAVEASGTDADDANDEQPDQESDNGSDNGGDEAGKAAELAATQEGQAEADAKDGDSSDSAEGNEPAAELPEATGEPVTDEGSKPKTATKAKSSNKK